MQLTNLKVIPSHFHRFYVVNLRLCGFLTVRNSCWDLVICAFRQLLSSVKAIIYKT